jgi:hypothetical protein
MQGGDWRERIARKKKGTDKSEAETTQLLKPQNLKLFNRKRLEPIHPNVTGQEDPEVSFKQKREIL